ncbi:hypothetical protein B0H12DRAFT_618508 [Mycena haematopus]|nr:hypothetical protein B0H12DRAFT_618508 [Mycena haematopus]
MRRVPSLPASMVAPPKLSLPESKQRKWRPRWRRDGLTVREVDLFHKWEIPLEAYKNIAPGPRFSALKPDWRLAGYLGSSLPCHPRLGTMPPPPAFSATSASADSESTLNRSLVVKGLMHPKISRFLLRIHQGPLEFARLDPEDLIPSPSPLSALPRSYSLTLSFLSSNSAHAFVHTHLSAPALLYEFTRSPNPSWQWLFPPTPLPRSVTAALKAYTARRAVSVSWFDAADKDSAGAMERFGAVEHVGEFGPGRFVVQFYAITDAIRAHNELRANPKLRVSFFPDWCEMDEQGRDILTQQGARHDQWMANWRRPAPRIARRDVRTPARTHLGNAAKVTTALTQKRVVDAPPASSTGTSSRFTATTEETKPDIDLNAPGTLRLSASCMYLANFRMQNPSPS